MAARRVTYRGHVQGVGFRYAALRLAQRLPLAGQVRNLADGRVELVVEGELQDIDDLLRRIAERMKDHIVDADVEEVPPTGVAGFRIAY